MFRKNKNKQQINYLDLTPIRLLNYQVDDDNKVSVFVPKFRNKILVKYLVPRMKFPDIKMKLDKLGSAAWLKCDGEKNVRQICDELLMDIGEEINPVEERVTKFFTQLYNYQSLSFKELEERK
jgi:hypothetical protein